MNEVRAKIDKCQCCLSSNYLRSITEPYLYCGNVENYSKMVTSCFSEVVINEGLICKNCIRKLRATLSFKCNIESARQYFQSCDITDAGVSVLNDNYQESQLNKITDQNPVELAANQNNESGESCSNEKTIGRVPSELSNLQIDSNDDKFNCRLDTDNLNVAEMKNLPYVIYSTDRECKICKREFSFYSELVQHMPEHYPNHICDVCGKICATKKSLVYHTKIHDTVRLVCKFCDKSFKNKSNLNAHVKVKHKGERIWYKCSECGEKLTTNYARIKHMSAQHGREEKIHKCPQCSHKYILASHLRTHIRRVHLQEKNYKCRDCSKNFYSQKAYKTHMSEHNHQ